MAKLSLEKLELLIGKVVVSAALFQQTYLAFKLLDTLLRNCTSFEVSISKTTSMCACDSAFFVTATQITTAMQITMMTQRA
jgi:hypothetical protein